MVNKRIHTIPYRRKRIGKTNYKRRLSLLKSGTLRMVIRKSNKHITAQIVKYNADGDLVVQSVHTNDLKNLGWIGSTSNIPSAYLLGYLLAMKTDKKQVIVDIGFQTPLKGSKIFSVVKGAMDGGLKMGAKNRYWQESCFW